MTNATFHPTKENITDSTDQQTIAYYTKWANDWPDALDDAIDNNMTFEDYVEYTLAVEAYDVQNGIRKIADTELYKRIAK